MSNQINVVATIIVKPEFIDEIINFFKNVVVVESRKEEGVIKYELNQDISNPNKLFVIEEYKSMEALEYHKTTKHFNELIKFSENKTDDIQISVMKKVY